MTSISSKVDVSIIIPIHNGSGWINQCFEGIFNQTAKNILSLEICVCDDASTDNTIELLQQWELTFKDDGIPCRIFKNMSRTPKGVGYAKNMAVSLSSGDFLCFQDVDDVMLPDRILKQYYTALNLPNNTIVGSKFKRNPKDSTVRYTTWANSITHTELNTQIYTAHGPTVIMPTWFFYRSVYDNIGGFVEDGTGTPEDLIFFYKHLDFGGIIYRVDECLLIYNYHLGATTFSVHEDTIWHIRINRLQKVVLPSWSSFIIWNAGKQGRKFYKSLSLENQLKVLAMCDVDKNKIGKFYVPFDGTNHKVGRGINIIHFKEAAPPFVICVKMNLTNGKFEENLNLLNLREGHDFVYFS